MNPKELEQLLNRHGAALQLFARQWADAPEDCVQQAFISLATVTPVPENPLAWLFRVVKNKAISQARSNSRRMKREARIGKEMQTAFQPSEKNEIDSTELETALHSLDDSIQEIVVARIWGQLNFEEIGQLVGCSSSSAHRKYTRGLNELRKTLGLTWLIKT